MKLAATLLWSIAICFARDNAAAAAEPRATRLNYSSWMKSCIGSHCFVGIEARGECMPSGGSVVISLEDGEPVSLSSSFSTKRGVQKPTSLRIDDGGPIPVPDQTCFPSGLCINKLAIDNDFAARLRRARTITIEAVETTGGRLVLIFSLADFARAYDGPGPEPQVFEEPQRSLKAKLRERGSDSDPPPLCED